MSQGWVLAVAAGVLLWRAASLRWPSSMISIPDGLRWLVALLGVLFLACAVWARWTRPNRFTAVFLLYGVGAGVHWGGSIGAPSQGLELSLLFVYLAYSALAESALLHLALIYPSGGPLAARWRAALYAPAALALLFSVVAGLLPKALIETVAGIVLLVAELFSVAAVVVFLVRLVRADPATRRDARLPLIVTALVVAGVLSLAGSVLPGQPDAWNLVLGAIPICLAFALVTQRPPD